MNSSLASLKRELHELDRGLFSYSFSGLFLRSLSRSFILSLSFSRVLGIPVIYSGALIFSLLVVVLLSRYIYKSNTLIYKSFRLFGLLLILIAV